MTRKDILELPVLQHKIHSKNVWITSGLIMAKINEAAIVKDFL